MSLETATLLLAALTGAVGLLAIAASLCGWKWFFETASARSLTGRMSRRSARLLYLSIGVAVTAMACFIAFSEP